MKNHTAYEIALIVMFVILVFVLSWAFTAFVVWLICLCFGIEFSFLIATGVWLALGLLGGAVKQNNS